MAYLSKSAAFIIGFTLTLLVLELFIQLSEINSTSISRNDNIRGIATKESKSFIRFNEGFYIGASNSYGYWGPAYDSVKPKNTFRIALVGDSYVEGHQVFERDHFRSLLENEFEQKNNTRTQVLNFGMSGFNLNDSYCLYMDYVKKFQPDLTLFFISNEDFTNTNSSNRRPQCVISGDSLLIDYSFRESEEFKHRQATSWYRGKSVLLGYVFGGIIIIKNGDLPNKLFPKWIPKKENVNSLDKKIKELPEKEKRIVEYLTKNERVLFVGTHLLDDKIIELFHETPNGLLLIPQLEEEKYHFWKVTKIKGHWNREGHKLVVKNIIETITK
jgi:hypothetical protein